MEYLESIAQVASIVADSVVILAFGFLARGAILFGSASKEITRYLKIRSKK